MSDPQWFEAHGLTIRCDGVSIDAVAASRTSSPDVSFEVAAPGQVPAYGEALSGSLLAHYDDHDGSALSVAELRGRAALVEVCFHGVALATIDRSTWNVVLRLAPYSDPDLAPVLISGIMLSVVLTLKKHPVLHASAVSVADGRAAVAFIGHSGMGKSTMATLMCRDGAALLTDDVLRTDVVGDTVRAFPRCNSHASAGCCGVVGTRGRHGRVADGGRSVLGRSPPLAGGIGTASRHRDSTTRPRLSWPHRLARARRAGRDGAGAVPADPGMVGSGLDGSRSPALGAAGAARACGNSGGSLGSPVRRRDGTRAARRPGWSRRGMKDCSTPCAATLPFAAALRAPRTRPVGPSGCCDRRPRRCGPDRGR